MAVDGIMTLLFAGVAATSTLLVVGRGRGWFGSRISADTPSIPTSSISDTPIVAEAPKVIETTPIAETAPTQIITPPTQMAVTEPVQTAEIKPKRPARRATRKTRSKKATEGSV